MAIVDLLMILTLFLVQPIYGAWAYRRYVARIEAGEPPDRLGQYREVLWLEWGAMAVLSIVWLVGNRPFADLGYVAPGGRGFWIGAVLLAGMIAYLAYGWHAVRRAEPARRERMIASLGNLVHFLPNDRRSYRWFATVSVTAGIVEETVYRGFVFWYFGPFLPTWAIVLVSAVAFGLGHSYQGFAGVVRVTAVGIAFGGYYWITGSIWLPILAHALLDLLQGAAILELLRPRNVKY